MIKHEHTYHQAKTGSIYSLLAWFSFAVSLLISKKIHPYTTVSMMVFFRTIIGAIFFFFAIWVSKNGSWKLARPWLMVLRSLSSLGGVAFMYLSLKTISIVDATLLQNCAPFFVPIFVFFWHKKPIDHRLWLPISIGFAGVLLILKPDTGFFHSGAFYALIAALTTALSMIVVRILTGVENQETALFYTFAIALIPVIPFVAFNWHVDSPEIYLPLLGLGFFAMLGQWFIFLSLQYASVTHMAPFSYSAVLYAGLFDWLFFNNVPDLISWIGLVAIVIGGFWILRLSKR